MSIEQDLPSALVALGFGFLGTGAFLVAMQLLSFARGSITDAEYGRLSLAMLAFALAATCFYVAIG